MKTSMSLAALLLIVTMALPKQAESKMPPGVIPVNQDDLTFHIRHVLAEDARDGRWERAPQLAQIILDEASRYHIDPLMLTVIVQAESSFREGMLKGKKLEIGLTQLVGAATQCDQTADIRTSRGQVRGGACWYALALELCKTELAALHAYQSGQCESNAYGPLYRLRLLKRARARIWYRRQEIEDLINPPKVIHPNGKSEYVKGNREERYFL